MTTISRLELREKFGADIDVDEALAAAGVEPFKIDAFDRRNDEFYMLVAADALLDAIEAKAQAASDEHRDRIVENLRLAALQAQRQLASGDDGHRRWTLPFPRLAEETDDVEHAIALSEDGEQVWGFRISPSMEASR